MKTALYRHFDADGALLYIGISRSPGKRLQQHYDTSLWAKEIAERAAIRAEKPLHNRAHVDAEISVRAVCDALGRHAIADACGIGFPAISNACVGGKFPAKWFLVIIHMCAAKGIGCPIELFSFISASPSVAS